jgi:hypothetical protein
MDRLRFRPSQCLPFLSCPGLTRASRGRRSGVESLWITGSSLVMTTGEGEERNRSDQASAGASAALAAASAAALARSWAFAFGADFFGVSG